MGPDFTGITLPLLRIMKVAAKAKAQAKEKEKEGRSNRALEQWSNGAMEQMERSVDVTAAAVVDVTWSATIAVGRRVKVLLQEGQFRSNEGDRLDGAKAILRRCPGGLASGDGCDGYKQAALFRCNRDWARGRWRAFALSRGPPHRLGNEGDDQQETSVQQYCAWRAWRTWWVCVCQAFSVAWIQISSKLPLISNRAAQIQEAIRLDPVLPWVAQRKL